MHDSNNDTPSQDSSLLAQSKEHLITFFHQPLIKKSISVLVPGILASILFPFFGPVVAAPAAAITIQNSLKLLGISLSNDTTKKILKPLEGKQIDEEDLLDVLQEILPADKQVNEEVAKALVTITPMVKEAALTNTKLDANWLGKNLKDNLKDQGETMALIADKVYELIQLDGTQLLETKQKMLANWTRAIQTITVSGSGDVNNSPQHIKGRGGDMTQSISTSEQGKVSGSSQSIDLT
jgi:hypothetical protein